MIDTARCRVDRSIWNSTHCLKQRAGSTPARKSKSVDRFLVRVVAVGEALELVVQSLRADAEDFRGAGFVARSELDGPRDHFLPNISERAAERNLKEPTAAAAGRAKFVG